MLAKHVAPVAILGAGLAGLTAARNLRSRGVPFVLFEASDRIAGLATTFQDHEGFTYDFGAHFITNRLAAAIGVSQECRDIRYYGETVLLRGKTYSYPFGLMAAPEFAVSALRSRLSSIGKRTDPPTAASALHQMYGHRLADEVAIPLLEAWSGASATNLSPAVLNKIPTGILQVLLLKLASNWTNRAIAIGYGKELPSSVRVWHVYPEGGLSRLCRHLASDLGHAIQLRSPVETILVESNLVVGVSVHGKVKEVSAVISTAPVTILAKLVHGTETLKYLSKFRYRPMLFANLRFNGRGLLPDVVLWIPERRFPFFRLTETPLSMPWLAPQGKTIITADIGCEVGDSSWCADDAQLTELCLDALKSIIPDARQRFLGGCILRTPFAYPIFLNEYEVARQGFELGTGVAGLYSIGRNGEFDHLLTEDVYWRTLRRMPEVVSFLKSRPLEQSPPMSA